MLELEHLTFTYPGAAQPTLRDITLRLPASSLTLLSGPSGGGKSTLLRCLNGLIPHTSGGHLRGRVRVAGQDPLALGPARMSAHVGFVAQDPESQFITGYVEDEIAFSLENAGWPRAAIDARVYELLESLHLSALRGRRLESLSGGEQQRVLIAAVLAPRPKLLLLDEPTSQLDPDSARDVLQLLAQLKAAGLTILIAEHRLERILPFADFFIWMEAGRADGRPVTAALRATLAPPGTSRAAATSGVALSSAEALLTAEALTVRYGTLTALDEVSLSLRAGELVALTGANGAGKSTLLRTLMGLQKPLSGCVHLLGAPLPADIAQTARQVAYLPQDPNALLFAESVRAELAITLRNHGLLAQPPIAPDALLASLGLDRLADAYPRDLSAGQRQRVALAALLVTRPRVLLLDEPTRGLDAVAKGELLALLQGLRAQGMGVLVATHDIPRFTAAADRVLHLERGRLVGGA